MPGIPSIKRDRRRRRAQQIKSFNRLVLSARFCIKLLALLDFITLRLWQDRLAYQGDIICKLIEDERKRVFKWI